MVDDFLKDIGVFDPSTGKRWTREEYDKEHPTPWWRPMYLWLARRCRWVEQRPHLAKAFLQRGKRGWADRDTWGFDYHLAKIITEGVIYLRKIKHGAPGDLFYSGRSDEEGFAEWDEILVNIIHTFETAQKIIDHDWFYIPTKEWRDDRYKSHVKLAQSFNEQRLAKDAHAMTKEECEKYERGFHLFQKYFFNLWD